MSMVVSRCAGCLALVGLVGAIAACTPGTPALDLITRVQPGWSVAANLVGSPDTAEGVVVSYVNGGEDNLEVVAWDTESGDELWRDAASLGSIPRYSIASARILEIDGAHLVVYVQMNPDDDRGWQRVVVAELETGKHTDPGTLLVNATSLPGGCDGEEGICLNGTPIEHWEDPSRRLRVDLSENRLVTEEGTAAPTNTRYLGGNVYSTSDPEPGNVEMLGYGTEEGTDWERPYSEVFAPGYSSDGGWSWFDDDTLSTVVGTGYSYDPSTDDDAIQIHDHRTDFVVGLDRESGRTEWKVSGADRMCDAVDIEWSLVTTVIPVCMYAGGTTTIDRTIPDRPTIASDDVEARLVGLDAETGDELWSIDAGSDPSLIRNWTRMFASHLAVRPVMLKGTLSMVNVLTGEVSVPSDDAGFACQSERPLFSAYWPGSTAAEPDQYMTGAGVFSCDSDRYETTDGFTPGALKMAATNAGEGWFVVAGRDRLSGFYLD